MNGRRTLAALCLGLLLMITFVGQAVGTTSAALPTFVAGDLALVFAFRDGSTTLPTLPAGWTSVLAPTGANTCSMRVGYRVLVSGDTTTGTWTSASRLVVHVYRSTTAIAYPGASASASGASTTVSYPALSGGSAMKRTDGTSWVAGFAGHRSVDTALETPPTGMTNRSDGVDATAEAAGHDTNGGVASRSLQTVSVGGTSSGWFGATVEIVEAQFGDEIQVLYTDNFSSGSAAAFPQAVHAGTLLVAGFGRATNSTPTVTDTQSDGWALGRSHYDAGNDYRVDLWYATAASSAACSVTVTAAGGAGERVIGEYYGPFDAAPLDTGADAIGTSNSPSSGNATTTVNGELCLGFILAAAGNTSWTPGASYIADSSQAGGTNADTLLEHQVLATAGSIAATATLSGSFAWDALLATFKAASGDILFAQAIF